MYRIISRFENVKYHDLSKNGQVLGVVYRIRLDQIVLYNKVDDRFVPYRTIDLTEVLTNISAIRTRVEIRSIALFSHGHGLAVSYCEPDLKSPVRIAVSDFCDQLPVTILDQQSVNGHYDADYGGSYIRITDDDQTLIVPSPNRNVHYKGMLFTSVGAIYVYHSPDWLDREHPITVTQAVVTPDWIEERHGFGGDYSITPDGLTMVVSTNRISGEALIETGSPFIGTESVIYTYDRESSDSVVFRMRSKMVLMMEGYVRYARLRGRDQLVVNCKLGDFDRPGRLEYYEASGTEWVLTQSLEQRYPHSVVVSDVMTLDPSSSVLTVVTDLNNDIVETYGRIIALSDEGEHHDVVQPDHRQAYTPDHPDRIVTKLTMSEPNCLSSDRRVLTNQHRTYFIYPDRKFDMTEHLTVFSETSV